MQKIATNVFICASVVFGVIGILVVFTIPQGADQPMSPFRIVLMKSLFTTVFVILSSFALSVAGKYLKSVS
jgi:hypothetical protein